MTKLLLNIFLGIACLFIGARAVGQNHEWKNIGLESGLSSEEVYKLHIDQEGYLWAFNEMEAMKYNGRKFEKAAGFSPNGSVGHAIATDKDGKLWIYTSKGDFGCYQNDSFLVHPVSREIRKKTLAINNVLFQVQATSSGDFLMSTHYETFQWDRKQNKIKSYFSNNQQEFKIEKIEGVWIVSKAKNFGFNPSENEKNLPLYHIRINKWLNQKDLVFNLPMELSLSRSFVLENKAGLWIALTNELVFVNRTGKIHRMKFQGTIIQMKKTSDDRIWVCPMKMGIHVFRNSLEPEQILFPEYNVSDILEDADKNFWISTLESGVFLQTNTGIQKVEEINSDASFIQKQDSSLMVGFGNNGLQVFSKNKWRQVNLPQDASRRFTDLIKDGNSYLLGSSSGSFRLNQKFEFQGILTDSKLKVKSAVFDLEPYENGYFWVSHRRGIGMIRGNTIERLASFQLRTTQLKWWNQKLWVATDDGLYVYEWRNHHLQESKVVFKGQNIKMLKAHGNLLIVSVLEKGLYQIDNLLKTTPIAGLNSSNQIYDVYFLSEKEIVLGTRQGLLAGDWLADKKEINLNNRLFDQPILQMAVFENQLWFGTKRGLFKVGLPLKKQKQSRILFQKMEYAGKRRPYSPGVEIPADHKELIFTFDHIALTQGKTQLQYVLEGPIRIKGNNASGQIQFLNLPKGMYTLTLKVFDDVGIEIPGEKKYTFEVMPSIWETWWLRTLGFILFLILVTLISWLVTNYYRRKFEESNRLQQMIASYKITALQSQMNPHFIANALTAIQNLILSERIKEANTYLTRFSRMLRQVLELSDKPFISLENEISIIQLNIELERLRFFKKFDFLLQIETKTAIATLQIPTLITQPFIENAIWHGLLPLSQKTEAVLLFKVEEKADQLTITIQDNGVGRGLMNENETVEKKSMGKKLSLSRIESLNKALGKDLCSLEIIDLTSPDGQSMGTRVVLIFPNNLHEIKDQSLFGG